MYDQSYHKIGSEGPKFSIGTKTETKMRESSPGPCAYDPSIEYVKSKSPKISLHGRSEL